MHFSCPCEVTTFTFEIFNRWGKRIYSTHVFSEYLDVNQEPKDGKDRPTYSTGTYFWLAKYQVVGNAQPEEKVEKGYVRLISGN